MSTYFQSWRRKLGVVTLALACVLMAGWLESLSFEETIGGVCSSRHGDRITYSRNGAIECVFHPVTRIVVGYLDENGVQIPLKDEREESPDDFQIQPGISGYVIREEFRSEVILWRFSYWTIVIPLTLLSTWLLLSKLRATRLALQAADTL